MHFLGRGGSRRRRFWRFVELVSSRIFLMTTMASAEAFVQTIFGLECLGIASSLAYTRRSSVLVREEAYQ